MVSGTKAQDETRRETWPILLYAAAEDKRGIHDVTYTASNGMVINEQ
jgi:hypothetical protein